MLDWQSNISSYNNKTVLRNRFDISQQLRIIRPPRPLNINLNFYGFINDEAIYFIFMFEVRLIQRNHMLKSPTTYLKYFVYFDGFSFLRYWFIRLEFVIVLRDTILRNSCYRFLHHNAN